MRLFRVLVLAFALVVSGIVAGCFGGDDEPPADDGGNGTTPPPGGDGTTPPPPGGDGNGTTPPPPSFNNVEEAYTITLQGQAAAGEHPFNVPGAGWSSFTVTVNARGPNPALPFLADSVVVSVLDPSGTSMGSATFSAGPPSDEQTITISSGAAGPWTIMAESPTAAVAATVSGTISIVY